MRRLQMLPLLLIACGGAPDADDDAPRPASQEAGPANGLAQPRSLAVITPSRGDTAFTFPTATDWLPPAGSCPDGWPQRVQTVLDSGAVQPLGTECRGMVADFNSDGRADMALSVETPTGGAYVAVLDGEPPTLMHITESGPNDQLFGLAPGTHFLTGCYENLDDAVLEIPHPGVAVSVDEQLTRFYYLENGQFVSETACLLTRSTGETLADPRVAALSERAAAGLERCYVFWPPSGAPDAVRELPRMIWLSSVSTGLLYHPPGSSNFAMEFYMRPVPGEPDLGYPNARWALKSERDSAGATQVVLSWSSSSGGIAAALLLTWQGELYEAEATSTSWTDAGSTLAQDPPVRVTGESSYCW